ncbi:hypothetical protein PPACK8108_LOCUS20342 [Phakopsora pachyrhizi]|uniref:Secreted protein n=1 Tax=Phakopsora pachyrhizi TaxID=170000 RepID=A0AAV0BHM0_PHAPC|nr:hypothetical protein PPACK8108_LOCUS20342 [Phakopsora pachyrhizi]
MIFLARLDGRNLAPLFFSIFFVNVVQCAGMGSNLELSKEAEVSRVLQEGISIAKTSKTEKVLAQCSLPNDKKVGINAGSKLKRST